MIVYFLRHAEAEDSGPSGDYSRCLTEFGLQRSREAGEALAALEIDLTLILTSPLVRAVQTAEQVAEVLGVPVAEEPLLGGRFDLDSLQQLCEARPSARALLLVGHEPCFSHVIGQLIGDAEVEMKKGAVACVSTLGVGRGSGTLRWLITGRQLSLMRGA